MKRAGNCNAEVPSILKNTLVRTHHGGVSIWVPVTQRAERLCLILRKSVTITRESAKCCQLMKDTPPRPNPALLLTNSRGESKTAKNEDVGF